MKDCTLNIQPSNVTNSPKCLGKMIKDERDALITRNTFTIVPRTPEMQPVPIKCLFTTKTGGGNKARVVGCGHQDPEKYTTLEIAPPTPNQTSVKWLIAFVIKHWNLQHIRDRLGFS